jgi:hypothetical protein
MICCTVTSVALFDVKEEADSAILVICSGITSVVPVLGFLPLSRKPLCLLFALAMEGEISLTPSWAASF